MPGVHRPLPPLPRRVLPPTLALACALSLATAGCNLSLSFGGLDTAGLEEEILAGLESEMGVDLDRAECPDSVEPRQGDVFVCRVHAADGSVGTVEVEQTDDQGNVTWELTEVLAPEDQ